MSEWHRRLAAVKIEIHGFVLFFFNLSSENVPNEMLHFQHELSSEIEL